MFSILLTLCNTIQRLMTLTQKYLKNIVRKGEYTGKTAFTLCPDSILCPVNSLPNNKILYLSKFKAFPDDKIILTQKLKFVLGKVENFVGKGYQQFLHFPQCFQKLSFPEVLKGGIVWKRVIDNFYHFSTFNPFPYHKF